MKNDLNKEQTRQYLEQYNVIKPYPDYYAGQIERLQNDIYQLQRCVEALVVLLVENKTIELEDFSNES